TSRVPWSRAGGQRLRVDSIMPLPIVIPLPIRPAAEARLGEHFLIDLPRLAQPDLGLELVDLLAPFRRHVPGELFFPCERRHRLEFLLLYRKSGGRSQ